MWLKEFRIYALRTKFVSSLIFNNILIIKVKPQ